MHINKQILLDMMRETQASAERARRLASSQTAPDVIMRLREYADELDQAATSLQRRAAS